MQKRSCETSGSEQSQYGRVSISLAAGGWAWKVLVVQSTYVFSHNVSTMSLKHAKRSLKEEEDESLKEFNKPVEAVKLVDSEPQAEKPSIFSAWDEKLAAVEIGTEPRPKPVFDDSFVFEDLKDAVETSGKVLQALTNARQERLMLYSTSISEISIREKAFRQDMESLELHQRAGFAGHAARAEEDRAIERLKCREDIERIDKELALAEQEHNFDRRMLEMMQNLHATSS